MEAQLRELKSMGIPSSSLDISLVVVGITFFEAFVSLINQLTTATESNHVNSSPNVIISI